jgi:hypothetical protein
LIAIKEGRFGIARFRDGGYKPPLLGRVKRRRSLIKNGLPDARFAGLMLG